MQSLLQEIGLKTQHEIVVNKTQNNHFRQFHFALVQYEYTPSSHRYIVLFVFFGERKGEEKMGNQEQESSFPNKSGGYKAEGNQEGIFQDGDGCASTSNGANTDGVQEQAKGGDNRQEVARLAKQETQNVKIWRRNVILMIVATAAVVTSLTFVFLQNADEEEFQTSVCL
jgi:hypothetical protein